MIIVINWKIFKSFEKLKSKWILKLLIIVYASCFGLSPLFYIYYSIPLIRIECKKRKKEEEKNKSKEKNVGNINNSQIN